MTKLEARAVEEIERIISTLEADKAVIKTLGIERLDYEAHHDYIRAHIEDYIQFCGFMSESE